MAASYYTAGTISVAAASTALTFVGAAMLSGAKPGDTLIIGATVGVIASIEGNLAATLAQPWAGATVAASANYLILRTGADWSSNIPAAARLAEIIAAIEAGLQVAGALSIPYIFSTTTADSDPGVGNLRLGNATQNAATVIRADLANANGGDVTGLLAELVASNSGIKSRVKIFRTLDPSAWLAFDVTAMASPAGYRNLAVTPIGGSSASPFVDGDIVTLVGTPNGDVGSVPNGSVTNAKLAPVAQYKVKARFSAGIGDYEDVAIGAGLKLDASSLRLDFDTAYTFANDLLVSAIGGTTAVPRLFGLTGFAATRAARFTFGGAANSIQMAYGGRMTVQSANGLVLAGARDTNLVGFDTSGGGAADTSVTITGNDSSRILDLKDNAGNLKASVDADGILRTGGIKRLAASVSKTSDATSARLTPLAVNVKADKRYRLRGVFWVDCGTTGGHKFGLSGTCTATSVLAQVQSSATGGTTTIINARLTALGGSAGQAGSAGYFTTIDGFIDVATDGILAPTFAQNASNATASTVLAGSFFEVQEID